MFDKLFWFIRHARAEKLVLHSRLSESEILLRVKEELSSRSASTDATSIRRLANVERVEEEPNPRISSKGRDLTERLSSSVGIRKVGRDDPFESRNLWGKVGSSSFELATKRDYRANRDIIPFIKCKIRSDNSLGTRVDCRIRMALRSLVVTVLYTIIFSIAAICYGIGFLFESSTRLFGLLSISVACLALFGSMWFLNDSVPIAERMLEQLKCVLLKVTEGCIDR